MNYYRTIDHVVETLKNNKGDGRKSSLLIGAGCSATANVPTANGFVEEIRKKHNQCYETAPQKTYASCMAELSPGERKRLIKGFVDRAKINWTHLCVAQLIKEGYVDRVLTTNFDLLAVRACACIGEFPSVYDFASSQVFKPADIQDNAVFYLHGQYTGFVLMNTKEEVEKYSNQLAPVFENAGEGRTWIVAGYSGENDPVFNHLANVKCFDYKLYWIGYEDKPAAHVEKQLLTDNRYAFFIPSYDSDRFFITLTQKLGCFPPQLFTKPFSHLSVIFNFFTPFPVLSDTSTGGNELDFSQRTQQMINDAIDMIEKGIVKPVQKETIVSSNEVFLKAQEYYMKGNYENVVNLYDGLKNISAAEEMLFWSFIGLGNEHLNNATEKKVSDVEMSFDKAIENYKQALQVRKKSPEPLYNWGLALYYWAPLEKENKEKLYNESCRKYEEALNIKPDYQDALYNWGLALYKLAEIKIEDEDKKKLYKESCQKYEAVLNIKPDYQNALYNWGLALYEWALLEKENKEKEKLYKESCQKYEAVLNIKPDYQNALFNWGLALYEWAKIKKEDEAKKNLYKESCRKYESALKIKQEDYEAFYNWGLALYDWAQLEKVDKEKEKLYNESCRKYEATLKIKPDYQNALYNWGLALYEWAKIKKEDGDKKKLYKESCQKYESAIRIKQDDYEALYNWGLALYDWAQLEKVDKEKEKLYNESCRKYEATLKIKPDYSAASYNRGLVQNELAKLKEKGK